MIWSCMGIDSEAKKGNLVKNWKRLDGHDHGLFIIWIECVRYERSMNCQLSRESVPNLDICRKPFILLQS